MGYVVLGSGPQALFVLRCLSKLGHNVKLLSFDRKVAFYSKYGVKFTATDKDEFISYLKNWQSCVDKIFICGGKELQFVLDEFHELFVDFDVYPKPLEAIKIFSDKVETYQYLSQYGIRAPKSYSVEEIMSESSLSNSVIVKWNQEVLAPLKASFKTKIFESLKEVQGFLGSLDTELLPLIVVQDYIHGEEANNISFQVAFSNQQLKGHLLSRKLRVSKNGFTSYLEEIDISEDFRINVYEPFISAMKDIKYSGLAEIEFKICDKTGDYFLIEVNPRPCGLVSAMNGKYKDFESFFTGKPLVEKDSSRKVRWTSILRDVQTCLQYFRKHHSVKELYRDLCSIFTSEAFDIFDLNDLKPFLSQITSR